MEELADKFRREVDPSGFNLDVVEGRALDREKLLQLLSSPAFGVRKRMAIIKNFLRDNKDKELEKDILSAISKYDREEAILVFWEDASGGKKKQSAFSGPLYKKFCASKFSYEFSLLAGQRLSKWIEEEAAKEGGSILPEAREALVRAVGSDLWQMSSEIKKLVSFKAREPITKSDVSSFVKGRFNDNIFDLIDMISAKNKRSALRLIDEQIRSGADEYYLLNMIAGQFRILVQVRDILDKDGFPRREEVSSKVGIHPFVAQKAISSARNFTSADLKRIYSNLLNIDRRVKTGRAKPRLALDLLVMGI